jgi:carboxynorspermidine decarboxylase
LFDAPADLSPLYRAVEFLQCNYGLEVIIEPGAAFVRSAGYIVATVLDIFANGAKKIAVLDTTVNHMPEVFEYDFEPDVVGHDDGAEWEYILAGCTCLAGDLFGEYRFPQPLAVGDKVVFYNAGAYTMTKAHTFNGINLPAIYALTDAGALELKKRFTYADYAARWGAYAGSPV